MLQQQIDLEVQGEEEKINAQSDKVDPESMFKRLIDKILDKNAYIENIFNASLVTLHTLGHPKM